MKLKRIKYILFGLFLAASFLVLTGQTADPNIPAHWYDKVINYIKDGQFTMTYKTLTTPTITTPTISGGTITGNTAFTGSPIFKELNLGQGYIDSTGRTMIKVQNKSGSALAEGDVCVWDASAITVFSLDPVGATLSLDDTLAHEGGFFVLSMDVGVNGTPDAGDTITVIGKSYEAAGLDTVGYLMPAANSESEIKDGTSRIRWYEIDSITMNTDAQTGADSIAIYATPVMGVALSGGSVTTFAGVATGAIADNAWGYICNKGVTKVVVDAASTDADPGVAVDCAANGDGVTAGSWTAGQTFGVACEMSQSDNTKILVDIR